RSLLVVHQVFPECLFCFSRAIFKAARLHLPTTELFSTVLQVFDSLFPVFVIFRHSGIASARRPHCAIHAPDATPACAASTTGRWYGQEKNLGGERAGGNRLQLIGVIPA